MEAPHWSERLKVNIEETASFLQRFAVAFSSGMAEAYRMFQEMSAERAEYQRMSMTASGFGEQPGQAPLMDTQFTPQEDRLKMREAMEAGSLHTAIDVLNDLNNTTPGGMSHFRAFMEELRAQPDLLKQVGPISWTDSTDPSHTATLVPNGNGFIVAHSICHIGPAGIEALRERGELWEGARVGQPLNAEQRLALDKTFNEATDPLEPEPSAGPRAI